MLHKINNLFKKIFNKNPDNYWFFNFITWVMSLISFIEKIWPFIYRLLINLFTLIIGACLFTYVFDYDIIIGYSGLSGNINISRAINSLIIISVISILGTSRRNK